MWWEVLYRFLSKIKDLFQGKVILKDVYELFPETQLTIRAAMICVVTR